MKDNAVGNCIFTAFLECSSIACTGHGGGRFGVICHTPLHCALLQLYAAATPCNIDVTVESRLTTQTGLLPDRQPSQTSCRIISVIKAGRKQGHDRVCSRAERMCQVQEPQQRVQLCVEHSDSPSECGHTGLFPKAHQ